MVNVLASSKMMYTCRQVYIILLEARTLTITPPMNLSTCIHHLTRGENVNYYITDELVYMYTSSYSRDDAYM
jgi:hypothetical protein